MDTYKVNLAHTAIKNNRLLSDQELESIAPDALQKIATTIRHEVSIQKMKRALDDTELVKQQRNLEIDEINNLQNKMAEICDQLLKELAQVVELRRKLEEEIKYVKQEGNTRKHENLEASKNTSTTSL